MTLFGFDVRQILAAFGILFVVVGLAIVVLTSLFGEDRFSLETRTANGWGLVVLGLALLVQLVVPWTAWFAN